MKRFSLLTMAAALAVVASCSDNDPTRPHDAARRPIEVQPQFSEHDPTNGSGACMLDDAKSWPDYMSGWSSNSDATKTNNCTTKDVRLAQSRATAYYNPGHADADGDGFVALQPGDNIQCTNNTVRVKMAANLTQGSQSTRHDFGIWLRTDFGSTAQPLSAGARTGECNHYNLPVNPLGANTVNNDGDLCADMSEQAQAVVDFGELEIPCETAPGTSELIVHSCIAWKVPGDEGEYPKGHCPAYITTGNKQNPIHTLIEGANGFRAGSLPGNTSKCNCEPTGLQVFVAPSSIVIEKVTVGGAGGPFGFTTTGGLSPSSFDLTTSGAGQAGKDSRTYSGLSAGEYSVTEATLPAGWDLTDVQCTAGGVVDSNDDSKVNITLTPGASVTCTFTNTKRGSIVIEKVTTGGFGGPFGFTTTGDGLSGFDLTTTAAGQAGKDSETFSNLEPGAYSVTESAPPAGWEFGGLSCSAGGAQDGTEPRKANITLAAGATVTCTYTNIRQAQLRIAKVTDPEDDPTEFTFTPTNWNGGTPFQLKHGDTPQASGFLSPGSTNYSVVETVPTDWELGPRSCVLTGTTTAKAFTSIADGVQLQLAAGEDVTCTFTNTLIPPDLSILKTRAAATVQVGGRAEYTITVSNAANAGAALNVELTDQLPVPNGSGLTWSVKSTSSDPTPSCNVSVAQLLTCTVATLAGGKSFSVTVESSVIPAGIVQLDPEAAGPIDIDGNLLDNGGRDWQALHSAGDINCAAGVGCQLDLSGKDDDSFGGGVKEDTENPKITTGSIPPNKSDLQRFYVATERIGNGAPTTNALYLAWVRVQAPKGTTNMDFELNQSSTLYPNNATPVRTHGDILVKYDLDSGGTNPTLGYHVWLEHGPDACQASNSYPCWSQVRSLAGSPHVAAAVNTVQVPDPIVGQNLDPYTFGEAYINLQGAGIFGSGCTSFGKAFLKSRSSSSFTSDVKDFVRPLDVEISNCAPVPLDNKASVDADNHDKIDSAVVRITISDNGT
jgi:uncharacterized repeat protein (TIGR01451 family)